MKSRSILRAMIAAAVLLLIGSTVSSGQTGTISGQVYDRITGQPLIGAWVGIVGTNLGMDTDSTGRFLISGIAPGKYEVQVSHPQYHDLVGQTGFKVEILPGKTCRIKMPVSISTPVIIGDADYKAEIRPDALIQRPETIDSEEIGNSDGESNKTAIVGSPLPAERRQLRATGQGSLSQSPDYFRPPKGGCYKKQVPYYPPPMPPYDMFFKDYGTNGFISASRDRFSTFAVDVDDASYTLARRYLLEGNLPPREAIRLEEFVNHFDYAYNPPRDEKFRIFSELAGSPFGHDRSILKIGIKGREISPRRRQPLNLTFVIDVSGSMGYDNRLQLVKESLRLLVSQLDRHDMVGIVAYGSRAYVAMEPISADQRHEIERAVSSLYAGGSTYAEAGLKLGYDMADRQFVNGHTNRIVLCSDGVANVGRTSADGIMQQVRRYAGKGITLSTFGFGMGNYNDVLLEQLAQKGNGRYAYVNDRDEARKQFVEDFVANMQILARDVKVQVEFNPSIVSSYRLVGYENRDVADHRFRDNNQDGGEIGAGHEVTAIYELELVDGSRRGNLATIFVRWKNPDETEVAEVSQRVASEGKKIDFNRMRPEFRLAVVAGKFADLLKGSEAADSDFASLNEVARRVADDMPGEQTGELLDLISRAANLSTDHFTWRHEGQPDDNYRNHRR